MEQNAQRELRAANPDWTVSELMAHLAKALASDGPALSFGATSITHVSEPISVVVATTGSSGVSKSVGLSASSLIASARASHKFLVAESGNSWSLLLPLTHIAGINVLIRSLELGTEPIDLRNFKGEYPRVDFTAIVPTQLFRAINGDERLLRHLKDAKTVLVGGAQLTPELHQQAKNLGINIVTTYGMTETSGGCVYNGIPLDGVEIMTTPEKVIAIKGSVVAKTYLGAESLWESKIIDGWFLTSDIGRLENGKLLVEGRNDDILISGGENISLSAIEIVLQKEFPGQSFAAFAVKDSQWGDALHIAVSGEESLNEEEVNNFLAGQFGAAGKPKGYLFLPELPLIGIGKVDRNQLVDLHMEASN
ncbi:MAG: AMP-binding protein [Actinobacteria bacterium]|nr:AMP-binding protein [Actinomycetota bacterium]